MVVLKIETFKTDKITAISVEARKGTSLIAGEAHDKSSGCSNYKSVKFAYDEGEVPPIRIDGDFRLFRFKNKNSDTYSLSITCDPTNESFFSELKGGFPVIAETTRNHAFSKEISQVILAAMVLAPNFYCKNCQRVILAMRGNPPQRGNS